MINSVPYEINKQNLLYICDLLQSYGINYTVFYGTMLGIHRDGKIIENDDDVDILISVSDYTKVLDVLKSKSVTLSEHVKRVFIQIQRIIDTTPSYIDIYFYYDGGSYIIEPWNFCGKYNNKKTHIHIPKNLIFPTHTFQYGDMVIKIPQAPEQLCQFLYGTNWRLPLTKNIDYSIKIVNNTPKITYYNQ